MKNQVSSIFVTGFLALVLVTSARATTYYVSTTGDDTNDGLTPATAWARTDRGQPVRLQVAHAAGVTALTNFMFSTGFPATGTLRIGSETIDYTSKTDNVFQLAAPTTEPYPINTFIYDNNFNAGTGFSPGDVIEVTEGTYYQQVNIYTMATAADPLVFRANGIVTIDAQGVRSSGFYLYKSRHIVIDGFRVTGALTAGIYIHERINPHNVAHIFNCDIYKNQGHGILASLNYNARHTAPHRIENCNIVGNGSYGFYGFVGPPGIKNCNIVGNKFGIVNNYSTTYGIAYISNNCFYANGVNLSTVEYPGVIRNSEDEINGLVFNGVSANNIVADPRFAGFNSGDFSRFYENSPVLGAADDGGNIGSSQNPVITPLSDKTYYVSTSGNDAITPEEAQNAGTPWATIGRAASSAIAGDSIIVAEGTYSGDIVITNSGTQEARINITGAGPVVINASGSDYGIRISRASGVRLDGFKVQNADIAGFCIDDSAYRNFLKNVSSSDNANGLLIENSYGHSVRSADMHNNTVNGIRMIDASSLIDNAFVRHNTSDGIYTERCFGVVVTNSEISFNRDGLHTIAGSYNIYVRTKMHHNTRHGANNGYATGMADNIHNVIESCSIFKNGSTGVTGPLLGAIWHIFNSNIYSNAGHGVAAGTNATDVDVQNCTIYANGGSGIANLHYHANSRQNIVNNIIMRNARYGVEEANISSSDRIDCNYNLFFENVMGNYYDIDTETVRNTAAEINADPDCNANIVADPILKGPELENFKLYPGSPCIDAGTSDPNLLAGPATHDILGNPRPAYAGIDIGSYELPDREGTVMVFF